MVTRQQAFTVYALAYAKQEPYAYADDALTLASAFGAIAAGLGNTMAGIDDLEQRLRTAGMLDPVDDGDDEPDVGPSARDAREREDAQVRLRQLIAADGKTDTGGRWLYDAAADEIVRQRDENALIRRHRDAERERADRAMKARGGWEESHRYAARLDTIVTILGRTDSETAEDTARRVAAEIVRLSAEVVDNKVALAGAHAELTRLGSEAHMAHEALEQARAKVDELRAMNANLDEGSLALAADAQHGREQGAAEMRERAARIVDEMLDEDLAGYAVIQRGKAVDAIGALPLDGAPAEQQRGVDAAGLEFVDERAERKAARVGEYSTMFMGGRMLPGRPRRSTPEPADELSPEDADALLASGTWRKSVCGVTWIGPAGGVVDPRTSFGLRGMREAAAAIRAKKAPPAAHGEPGKATGGDHAASGPDSVAEEQGAAQGASRGESPTAHVAGLLRRAMWHKTADRLESGEYTPQRARDVLRDWYLNEKTDEDDQKALAALDELARAGQPDAGPNVPVALPKPAIVEAGQRWAVDWRDITGKIDEFTVETANDNTARLIGGKKCVSYRPTAELLTSLRWTFLGPAPQDPSPKRDGGPEENGSTDHAKHARDHMVACIKLSHSWPQPARDVADTSDPTAPETPSAKRTALPVDMAEPTARDAVAGMLLRCGWSMLAESLVVDDADPAEVAVAMNSNASETPERDACIAALEALTRGDLCGARDHVGLAAVIARVTGERDDARASVKRLACGQDELTRQLDEMRRALDAGDSESTEQAGARVARERNEARAAADMHINTISGAIERLGAERHESLWHAADRVRRELDETNKTNAHLENERRRNIAAVEHLMRSGDEARAEAAALREEVERWTGRAADLERQRDEACKDALDAMREARTLRHRVAELETIAASFICGKCGTFPSDGESVTTAEMRPAEDIAREMVSDAHQSDFSMESRATLFGILVVPALQGDVDDLRRQIAHLIERIRAEGLRASGRERVEAVDVARLRAALEAEAEEFNRYGDDAALADARAMSRGAAMVQNERDARLVLSTLGFADMAIERVLGASSAKAPNPQNIAAAFKRIGEPAPGMRIERRADGEWLVGASEDCNDCEERSSDGMICTTHFDGQHISEGESDSDGATHIEARWPIASAAGDVESSRVAIPAADDLHLFSVAPGARVDLIVPKALDAHDVMRAVAELLGMPSETEELVRVAGQASDIGFASGVEEGERRAKVKAAGLAERWETRGDAIRAEAATSDTIVRQVLETDASRLRVCARRLRNAFGPTDVQARLEAERITAQAELDAGARVLAVHEKYRATARELVAAWRDAADEANNKAHAANAKDDGIGVARFSATERAIEVCISDLRDAFGVDPAREG